MSVLNGAPIANYPNYHNSETAIGPMRVIRTEFYVDPREVKWPVPEVFEKVPGISAVFFKADGEPPDPVELRKAAFWAATVSQPKSEAQLRVFLDECLRGTNDVVRSYFSGRLSSEEPLNEYNPQIIDRFYKELIIIEQSPPSGISFEQLAKGASSASIGALVGYYGCHEPMLFLTISRRHRACWLRCGRIQGN